MNYLLDRSDFEEQIVKTILKIKNTSKHIAEQFLIVFMSF